MMKKQNQKSIMMVSLVSGSIVLALYGAGFALFNKDTLFQSNTARVFNETFSGLPENTTANIQYITGNTILNDHIALTTDKDTETNTRNNDVNTALSEANQYNVHYTIQQAEAGYLDTDLGVRKQPAGVDVSLSGLKSSDKVTVDIDGYTYHDAVPADWAGRLELNSQPQLDLANKQVCMTIKQASVETPLHLCHHIPLTTKGQEQS